MRSMELEILDTGEYTKEEYFDCLKRLGEVGRILGGDRASLKTLRRVAPDASSILDVGCGGGDFLARLRDRGLHLKGIDLNPLAIEYARQQHPGIDFTHEALEDIPSNSVDVVISTLVCHHLTDKQLTRFISECRRVARRKVILNDLHRHPIASFLYRLIAPPLFRNRLITHDGALSIERAFTRADWIRLLGPLSHTLRWHFPFRWVVVLEADDG